MPGRGLCLRIGMPVECLVPERDRFRAHSQRAWPGGMAAACYAPWVGLEVRWWATPWSDATPAAGLGRSPDAQSGPDLALGVGTAFPERAREPDSRDVGPPRCRHAVAMGSVGWEGLIGVVPAVLYWGFGKEAPAVPLRRAGVRAVVEVAGLCFCVGRRLYGLSRLSIAPLPLTVRSLAYGSVRGSRHVRGACKVGVAAGSGRAAGYWRSAFRLAWWTGGGSLLAGFLGHGGDRGRAEWDPLAEVIVGVSWMVGHGLSARQRAISFWRSVVVRF